MTTIQKLLGHQRLNSTMIYARVHDRTVAEDYYAAMQVVEERLEVALPETEEDAGSRVSGDECVQLLDLATQLAEPELNVQTRLMLVDRMCLVLNHRTPPEKRQPTENENGRQPRAPP